MIPQAQVTQLVDDITKASIDEIMKALQEPFAPEDIEWRIGSTNSAKTQGLALAYVTNRAIQKRLDDVFGCFGWRNEYMPWKNGQAQLCGISINFHGQWITKWDGADDSTMESVKGGLSDAMKRAAYQWGIGRYLYELEAKWVDIDQSKRIVKIPRLPESALPKGYKYPAEAPQAAKTQPAQPQAQPQPQPQDALKCAECGAAITDKVAKFSTQFFGTPLCMACQKKHDR